MSDEYSILDIPLNSGIDTSLSSRINEVSEAARLPMVGLVDEETGGVIGYISAPFAEAVIQGLNRRY